MSVAALLLAALASQPGAGERVFVVDAASPAGPCNRSLWANIGYDPMWISTVDDSRIPFWRFIRRTGAVVRVRCHNTFSSGLPPNPGRDFPLHYFGCDVSRVGPDGSVSLAFQQLDDVLDIWVAAGIDPIVELDFMPDCLAEGPIRRNYGGGAINGPRDYGAWEELIRQTVRHMVERYGLDAVRRWRFELWNEPDLARYFIDGGLVPRGVTDPDDPRVRRAVARLCRMYDHAAGAIKSVDPLLKVGGPGIAGRSAYLAAFVKHCLSGRATGSGKTGTPLDFISWHGYAFVPGQLEKIGLMRRIIEGIAPRLLAVELQQNEWGLPLARNRVIEQAAVGPFEAAHLCRMIAAMWSRGRPPVDLFLRWGQPVGSPGDIGWRRLSVTSSAGAWAPAPVLQAYALLARFGPRRLSVEPADSGPIGVLAARSPGGLQLAVFYADERDLLGTARPVAVTVRIRGLSPNDRSLSVRHFRLDSAHGDVAGQLRRLFSAGARPPAAQVDRILSAASNIQLPHPTRLQVRDGTGELTISLPSAAVSFLFIGEVPAAPSLKPSSRLLRRVIDGEDAYWQALLDASAGRGEVAAAAMEKVAADYTDLVWGWKAEWWLACYYGGQGQPRQALGWVDKMLSGSWRRFDRAQLLQWAADRATDASDAKARAQYLAEMEKELNAAGATSRWLVSAVPPVRRGQPIPRSIPFGVRSGQALSIGGIRLQLKPLPQIVGGYGVQAGKGGAATFGLMKVRCPSARRALLEIVPRSVVAVWCNGRLAYRLTGAGMRRARDFAYIELPLRPGANEVAALSPRGQIRLRLVDEMGQPMRDIEFLQP